MEASDRERVPRVVAARPVSETHPVLLIHRRRNHRGGPPAAPPGSKQLRKACDEVVEVWDVRHHVVGDDDVGVAMLSQQGLLRDAPLAGLIADIAR